MIYAAILAGGRGTRMGGGLPKQFLELHGEPIIVRTLRKFVTCAAIDRTAVCIPGQYLEYTRELLAKYPDICKAVDIIEGGGDRTGSLENACKFFTQSAQPVGISDDDVIVTHDCVRPFITHEMILSSIDGARKYGGATAAVACVDTICVSAEGKVIDSVPNRAELYSVQTPQTFMMREFCDILGSLSSEEKSRVTDASAVFLMRGRTVAISEGSPSNIKITHPSDIALAQNIAE